MLNPDSNSGISLTVAPSPLSSEPSFPPSALYIGHVGHHRYTPKVHRFRYPIFQAFVNLDDLDGLCRASAFVSRNRFNWASIHDEDYLVDRPEATLCQRFAAAAREAGQVVPDGPVFLLANLRYLGLCFNPVAYYYAYDLDGRLALICAEITNTPWNECHRYWMAPGSANATPEGWVFDLEKVFHVSPFMPMELRYRWIFESPAEGLRIHMALFEKGELCFGVDLSLTRSPWQASQILRTLLRFPWITLKTVFAIYWEALCLWMKRVPVFTHPKKLAQPEA